MNTHYLPYFTGWTITDKHHPDAITPPYLIIPAILRANQSKYIPHIGLKQKAKVAMKQLSKTPIVKS